jgi:hypothetical protein
MKRTMSRALLMTGVAALALGGCRRDEPEPETAGVEIDAPEILSGVDTVYASVERQTLPPSRIYYTLTDHPWYARGEPLVHENAAYHAAGMPVAASVDQMQHAGEYQGVDYYLRQGDERQAVYVPIYEGYWQSFRADTAARAGT